MSSSINPRNAHIYAQIVGVGTRYMCLGAFGGMISGFSKINYKDSVSEKAGKVLSHTLFGSCVGFVVVFWPISVPLVSYYTTKNWEYKRVSNEEQ